jgi:hypothetical protein
MDLERITGRLWKSQNIGRLHDKDSGFPVLLLSAVSRSALATHRCNYSSSRTSPTFTLSVSLSPQCVNAAPLSSIANDNHIAFSGILCTGSERVAFHRHRCRDRSWRQIKHPWWRSQLFRFTWFNAYNICMRMSALNIWLLTTVFR